MRRLVSFVFLVAVILFMPVVSATQQPTTPDASEPSSDVLISIYPKGSEDGTRFEATMEPGQEEQLVALIGNLGSDPIDLRTFSSDIVPMMNGGLSMAEVDSERHDQTLWLDYPTEEFSLEPGEIVERTLTIKVPENTPPGQYVNAVALETVQPVNDGEGGAFSQYFRKVVSVYITVPGETNISYSVGEPLLVPSGSGIGLQLPIMNTGNTRLDLMGTVTISRSDGTVLHSEEFAMGPVYMGQETYFGTTLASVPTEDEVLVAYSIVERTSEIAESSDPVAVAVPETTIAGEAPVAFDNVVVEANADPIVFSNVSVDVTIADANYPSTRLTLSVFHNGEHVEDFILADNLSLTQGTTNVSQRYLPGTNWESGTYTFSLKLESTDGGQASSLLEESDVATLEVP